MTNKVYHRKGNIFVADDGDILQPAPGGVKLSYGHSGLGPTSPRKTAPREPSPVERVDDRVIARKVSSGLRLSASEETRLIETMAALGPEADTPEQTLINQMAAL